MTVGVRMLDVAEAAGVSRSTVSNVMRGSSTVSGEIRDKVLAKAAALGYVYDRSAANLRTRQSHLVGLIIPDLANPFIAAVVRGTHEVLAKQGFLIATVESGDDISRQDEALLSLSEHRADGFVILPAMGTEPDELMTALAGHATVLINRDIGCSDLDYVGPDEPSIGALGANHLLMHGCRRVAYFGGPRDAIPRIVRSEEFARAIARAGAACVEAWTVPTLRGADAAFKTATGLLRRSDPPDGIMCHSDDVAYGVLRALAERGITPEECRVVGCDDIPSSRLWNPSLTSIAVGPEAIGRAAAQRLLKRITGTTRVTGIPAPHLVARESCGCHVREGLSVATA
ncbi:MAG TPA: LacI family DNA-binding transcriptional regulator [Propionibacteriaceae bacterium]|nr:LacI family DNA-binding transcriptional regulator [Propionibacteriaceae bacterium]